MRYGNICQWNTNKALLSAQESNSRVIQRVMRNNTHLLKRIGISVNEQARRIFKTTDGFRLRGVRMCNLKAGRERKADITIISLLANFHNIPLEDMLIKEFWKE